MSSQLILHIPHSSSYIPSYEGFIVDKREISAEVNRLTDWFSDELFSSPLHREIIANFSRVFCDSERFSDDSKEPMSKVGMGVLYEKTDDGRPMRNITEKLREDILTNYYFKHHKKLTDAVREELTLNGKALIIDCHSFSDKPFIRDIDQRPNRPHINIGTDSYHTQPELLEQTVRFFQQKGFSVGVDYPYSGTIVPLEFYQQNNRVFSIMIEINRKLYMNETKVEKSTDFLFIKKMIASYYSQMKRAVEDL